MNYSTTLGDAVNTIVAQRLSGDAACRLGDMAEAMATVRPYIDHTAIVRSVVAYAELGGYVNDIGADDLLAALINHTPQR